MKTVFTIVAAEAAALVAHPILLLLVPFGIILCGAATGIAQALRIGLRAHLLRLMGIEERPKNSFQIEAGPRSTPRP